MTGVRLLAVFVLALMVQLTVFVDVRIAGVAPELLALVALLAGLYAGPDRGPTIAFGAGLLWDIYLPTPLGVSAIVFALAAVGMAYLEAGMFHDSRFQLVALSGLSTAGIVVAYALLSEVLGASGLVEMRLLKVAVVAGFLNALLAPLVAPLVRWALNVDSAARPRVMAR